MATMDRILTNDCHAVKVGDWLMDTTGVYEVTEIDWQFVYLREVVSHEWDGGYSDGYTLGETRRLTHKEAEKMSGSF